MNITKYVLTGNTGMRFGLFGRLIVQVEYREPCQSPGTFLLKWKDATLNEWVQATKAIKS